MVKGVLDLSRATLAWMIAGAAGAEALLESIVAGIHRDGPGALVWAVGAFLIFGVIAYVERIKVWGAE